ncbi:hypothetical protein MRX96_055561 [Rhipicephalus microplus]
MPWIIQEFSNKCGGRFKNDDVSRNDNDSYNADYSSNNNDLKDNRDILKYEERLPFVWAINLGNNPNSAVEDGSSCRQEEGVCEAPGKPDARLPCEGVGESNEKVDASSTGETFLGLADETPSEVEPMTRIENDSGNVTGKRPCDEGKKDKVTTAAPPDEPPAKMTPAQRLSFGHGQTFQRSARRRKRHLRHLKDCAGTRRSRGSCSCKYLRLGERRYLHQGLVLVCLERTQCGLGQHGLRGQHGLQL